MDCHVAGSVCSGCRQCQYTATEVTPNGNVQQVHKCFEYNGDICNMASTPPSIATGTALAALAAVTTVAWWAVEGVATWRDTQGGGCGRARCRGVCCCSCAWCPRGCQCARWCGERRCCAAGQRLWHLSLCLRWTLLPVSIAAAAAGAALWECATQDGTFASLHVAGYFVQCFRSGHELSDHCNPPTDTCGCTVWAAPGNWGHLPATTCGTFSSGSTLLVPAGLLWAVCLLLCIARWVHLARAAGRCGGKATTFGGTNVSMSPSPGAGGGVNYQPLPDHDATSNAQGMQHGSAAGATPPRTSPLVGRVVVGQAPDARAHPYGRGASGGAEGVRAPASVPPVFCTSCGGACSADDAFCVECGAGMHRE